MNSDDKTGRSALFQPLKLRGLELRNRIGMTPMCMYSAREGRANDWHFAHYSSRAALGLGLVIVEATSVLPEGRITPADLGIWEDMQIVRLAHIADFAKSQGAAVAIQLAHAGRKAGCAVPWEGGSQLARSEGGWQRMSAGPFPFKPGEEAPLALDRDGLTSVVDAFAAGAIRAEQAGFDAVEVHAAHGYLLHQFLSPLSNRREDEYGGSLENRARLLLEVCDAVRAAIPPTMPLLVRVSATDWKEGGWDVDECSALAVMLKARGVDLIDVSSGGLAHDQALKPGPGYQVPFARALREAAGIPTAAVGLITGAAQAQEVLTGGSADLVLMGREILRNPGWVWQAARELGVAMEKEDVPLQYQRAM